MRESSGALGPAALLSNEGSTDADLCYVCHGVGMMGSQTDVESEFSQPSAHVLAPSQSAFGPAPKQCSDCHDSHGSDRDASGDSYPSLLKAWSLDRTTAVFSGDAYCATCHQDRAADRWDGLAVWQATGHAKLVEPSSGTKIRCSICHVPHGSSIAPNIRGSIEYPAAPATTTVEANDRRLCLICHTEDEGTTWTGAATYATSSHAVSPATTGIPGEWAAEGATRKVGECQACHAPMGRSDGAGGAIPKLAEKASRALCDDCHDADGPAATDLASEVPTESLATQKELAVTFQPEDAAGSYGRLTVYSQEPTVAAGRTLIGPREFGARDAAASPASGEVGYGSAAFGGDTQGDGKPDLVVADPADALLRFFTPDPVTGLVQRTHSLGAGREPARFVAVGDFMLDAGGSLEIAIVSSMPATDAAEAYLYRERIQAGTTVLDEIAGPLDVGRGVSGVATGDVTGGGTEELVVTARIDDEMHVLGDVDGTWTDEGPYGVGSAPRGPSVGDAWPGGTKDEIALVRGSSPGEVAIFGGDGALKGSEAVVGYAGEASATAVGDVLPGIDGSEVVVAVDGGSGTSGLNIFPQDAAGLDASGLLAYDTGPKFRSGSLALGQLDGDTALELVVGNAGWRQDGSAGWISPSAQVFHTDEDGTALTGSQGLWGGGAELSGAAPSVVVADLGDVGRSRHPVGAVEGAHVSTETGSPDPVVRHVECTDCHNVHEAQAAPAASEGTAPDVYGRLRGAWGVQVQNDSATEITLTERRGVLYEYEVCLKCHSAWSESSGGRDIAQEFNTYNPSFHGVEDAPSISMPSGSFVSADPAWTAGSRLYCMDCHGDSDASRPEGAHVSDEAPLLKQPYLGARPSDAGLLCYTCHDQRTYESGGVAVDWTDFRSTTALNLHVRHTNQQGIGCAACHVGHGSAGEKRLLRTDIGFTPDANGGGCDGACHDGSPQTYSRS